MAGRVGFEPTQRERPNALAERPLQPYLSISPYGRRSWTRTNDVSNVTDLQSAPFAAWVSSDIFW